MNPTGTIRNWFASAARLPTRVKLIAVGGVAAVAVTAVGLFVAGAGRGCSSRDDVTARVSLVSSGLQQAAAQGKIKVEQLAGGIKRLNSAATLYNTDGDHAAYCKALDELSREFELGN